MISTAKADDNVPVIGKPRYNLIGLNPTWIVMRMAPSTDFDGNIAEILPSVPAAPSSVIASKATWAGLTKGGLFKFSKSVIIEEKRDANCTATYSIVDNSNVVLRPFPTVFPFLLGKGENIKVTSTGAGASPVPEVALLVKLA